MWCLCYSVILRLFLIELFGSFPSFFVLFIFCELANYSSLVSIQGQLSTSLNCPLDKLFHNSNCFFNHLFCCHGQSVLHLSVLAPHHHYKFISSEFDDSFLDLIFLNLIPVASVIHKIILRLSLRMWHCFKSTMRYCIFIMLVQGMTSSKTCAGSVHSS